MTVAELAAYVAPVFWFSPDELSRGRFRGPEIRVPEPFPFEPATDRPVVYYQLKEVVQGADAAAPIYQLQGEDRGKAVVDLATGRYDEIPVGVAPYAVVLGPDHKAYVSNWGGRRPGLPVCA